MELRKLRQKIRESVDCFRIHPVRKAEQFKYWGSGFSYTLFRGIGCYRNKKYIIQIKIVERKFEQCYIYESCRFFGRQWDMQVGKIFEDEWDALDWLKTERYPHIRFYIE